MKKYPAGLWLLPVFFVLHNYNELFGFIPVHHLLLFCLGVYVFAGIVFLILFLVSRSLPLASFITFAVLVFMLFFGAWHDLVKSSIPVLGWYPVFLPASIVLFTALTWYCVKKKQLARYLGIVVLILCGMEAVNLLLHWQQYRKDHNLIYPGHPVCDAYKPCNKPDSAKPDIYFLVFDEYTDNRSLQQLWHYDNSDITNWLAKKGFYIPDSSKANYSFTPYSISSILNMDYIDQKHDGSLPAIINKILKAERSMSNNETVCLLQKEHYTIRFFSPFKNAFNNLDVEREFDHYAGDKLFSATFPGRLLKDFGWKFKNEAAAYANKDRDLDRILNHIKASADASANRPPQFVYGHLMITHKPHIYDANGHISTKAGNTYTGQVQQANKKMKELVTQILCRNKKNTLIIIMGDHGFRHLPDNQRRFYFPNLSAFYFPDTNHHPALRNISAVNTFRIVFNQYFCQNLVLLKDSSILVKY